MFHLLKNYFLFKDLKVVETEDFTKKTLQEAQKIGLLYVRDASLDLNVLSIFLEELKGKEISLLSFSPNGNATAFSGETILTNGDVNWYLKPNQEKIKTFTEKDFDLIINLDTSNFLTFHYTIAQCKGYKIAFSPEYDTRTYDFIIKCNNITTENLIKNLKLYLT